MSGIIYCAEEFRSDHMDNTVWSVFDSGGSMRIDVHTNQRNYPIILEHGVLNKAKEVIRECGHVFLVSDDGVPEKWRNILKNQYPDAVMHVIPHGEASKNISTYQEVLSDMLAQHLSRKDTVIALGGGVVGDLAGFCASTYMRGIRFINIPTTSLAQIDSSIGGKTAIDMNDVKNCVGTFWQPSMVLIDPEVLSTLTPRLMSEGLAEAVKAGLIRDEKLFELFEQDDYMDHIDEILYRSLIVKKDVVEHDERESGERKLLNFGHTFGHAYESDEGLGTYLHGECVGMGMMTILKNEAIKARLARVLERLHLPLSCDADPHEVARLVLNDKKADHGTITIVQVDEVGKGHLEQWTMKDIEETLGL